MTKKIIYSLMAVLTLVFTLNSCVEDTDYETPQITCEFNESDVEGTEIQIQTIIDNWFLTNDLDGDGEINVYLGDTELPTIFDYDNTNYISGYVVSSDHTGNFYKELYIQNSSTNPTSAIKIGVNVTSLFTKYDIGRKIYIQLKDLALTRSHGEMFLGQIINGQVDEMNESMAQNNILRNCEAIEITPKIIDSPSDISGEYLGMFIQLDNMQFHLDLLNLPYVDILEDFDTHIPMTSCLNNTTIRLETSSFASFKDETIPQGSGSVKGVLTRDYGDDFYVLRVNDTDGFSFDGERCDPEILDCGIADSQGTDNLFEDDFETQLVNSLITGNGWTNYIQEGTEGWEAFHSTGASPSIGISARIGSYSSGDSSSIAWLITPAINFDAQNNETFVFKTSNSFSDGSNLELLFSSDWDGTEENIVSASWGTIPAAYITIDDDNYASWYDSGIVDLSCAEGTIYIAFKYIGSGDPDFDGTFELDEISVDFTP